MVEVDKILSKRGFALVFVVVIMAISVTVGTIIMSLSVQNSRINSDLNQYMNCYYMGQAQVLHVIDIMRTNMELIYEDYSEADSFFNAYDALVLSGGIQPLQMEDSSCANNIEVTISIQEGDMTEYNIKVISSIAEISRKFRAKVIVKWSDEAPLGEMFRVKSIEEV